MFVSPVCASQVVLVIKNLLAGPSLVVQGLRLCTPNTGGLGSIPGQGTRSYMPHAVTKTQHSQVNEKKKKLAASAGDVETRVQSVDWEDPLEEGVATHSSVLAWRIPWTEGPGGLQSIGWQSRTRLKWSSTHQQSWPRYPTNRISYIVLYCNRFVIVFTQIIHDRQTEKMKKHV